MISPKTINQQILVPIQWYTTIGLLPCWGYTRNKQSTKSSMDSVVTVRIDVLKIKWAVYLGTFRPPSVATTHLVVINNAVLTDFVMLLTTISPPTVVWTQWYVINIKDPNINLMHQSTITNSRYLKKLYILLIHKARLTIFLAISSLNNYEVNNVVPVLIRHV